MLPRSTRRIFHPFITMDYSKCSAHCSAKPPSQCWQPELQKITDDDDGNGSGEECWSLVDPTRLWTLTKQQKKPNSYPATSSITVLAAFLKGAQKGTQRIFSLLKRPARCPKCCWSLPSRVPLPGSVPKDCQRAGASDADEVDQSTIHEGRRRENEIPNKLEHIVLPERSAS